MKWKYIKKQALPACLSKSRGNKKDIHAGIEETIAERKKILQQWEGLFISTPSGIKKDIHAQLEETIAEHRRTMQQWGGSVAQAPGGNYSMQERKAA
jgi:uncharacterized protein YukE